MSNVEVEVEIIKLSSPSQTYTYIQGRRQGKLLDGRSYLGGPGAGPLAGVQGEEPLGGGQVGEAP